MNDILVFRDENFYLSNFYECSIEYDGLTYPNTEAAFQAQKCKGMKVNFSIPVNDPRETFTYLNPVEAKRWGRKIPLRPDWEQVKIDIMKDVVRAKFNQHPDLKEKLLSTGDCHIEEGNHHRDKFWGTVNRVGENHLGIILMELRDEFRNE